MLLLAGPLVLLGWLGYQGVSRSRQAAREAAVPKLQGELERMLENLAQAFPPDSSPQTSRSVPWVRTYTAVPEPAETHESQLLFEQARTAQPEQKRGLLDRLAKDFPDALARSGLPLLPLVRWEQVVLETDEARKAGTAPPPSAFANLEKAALFTHPSPLSAELWKRAAELRPTGSAAGDFSPWETHERTRREFAEALAKNPDAPLPGWLPFGDTWFYAERKGDQYVVVKFSDLVEWTVRFTGDAVQQANYPGINMVVSLRGKSLTAWPRAVAAELLAREQSGPFSADAIIADPSRFFAEQDLQARWLAGLLGCALLIVVGAFAALGRAVARERQLGELKSDFLSSVSHELRAPVASMRLMAENLVARNIIEEGRQAEYHRLIADECRRLSVLIANVLDFARIEQGRQEYHFEETDINALIADTVRLLNPRAEARRQTLQVSVKPLEQIPLIDGLAVQQALINLVDNALKFAPPESAITIALKPRDTAHWELSVADQGPGIAAVEHERIFERFYRVGSELRRETPGAGIGLSLVKHLAESHGGRVTVESQPGKGARFTLILPYLPKAHS